MGTLTGALTLPGFGSEVTAKYRVEHASRAFEPLFTTKPRGTGLGLAVVKKIMEAHHGQVSLFSRSNHGTTVTVSLTVER